MLQIYFIFINIFLFHNLKIFKEDKFSSFIKFFSLKLILIK